MFVGWMDGWMNEYRDERTTNPPQLLSCHFGRFIVQRRGNVSAGGGQTQSRGEGVGETGLVLESAGEVWVGQHWRDGMKGVGARRC